MRFIAPLAILAVSVAATASDSPAAGAAEVGKAPQEPAVAGDSATTPSSLKRRIAHAVAAGAVVAGLAFGVKNIRAGDKKCRDQAEEERSYWCKFVVGANNVFSRR